MRLSKPLLLATMALAAYGCLSLTTRHEITAHIVLDIRHIEDQASQDLDYIEGVTDVNPKVNMEAAEPRADVSFLERACALLSPMGVACAQELESKSARAKELLDQMRERFPKLAELKSKGYTGEDQRGYLALRPHKDLDEAALKNSAQKMIAEENADRKEYYREVARDENASLTIVEGIYAKAYRERAKTGHAFQCPKAGADFDAFAKSPLGVKLGDMAQPDAWVQAP